MPLQTRFMVKDVDTLQHYTDVIDEPAKVVKSEKIVETKRKRQGVSGKVLNFEEVFLALPAIVEKYYKVFSPRGKMSGEKLEAILSSIYTMVLAKKNCGIVDVQTTVADEFDIDVHHEEVRRVIIKLLSLHWLEIKEGHKFNGTESPDNQATLYRYTKRFTQTVRAFNKE